MEGAGNAKAVWVLNEIGAPHFTPGNISFLGSQTIKEEPELAPVPSCSNKCFSVHLVFLLILFYYWQNRNPWLNTPSMICYDYSIDSFWQTV